MRFFRYIQGVEISGLAAAIIVAWVPTTGFAYSFGSVVASGVDAQVCRIDMVSGGSCSGTLVGKMRILTAGHCAFAKRSGDAVETDIRGATVSCFSTVQADGTTTFAIRRKVVSVARNPEYNDGTVTHDSAFLTLDAPVRGIIPAMLDIPSDATSANTECSVQGYGRDSAGIAGSPARAALSEARRKKLFEDLPADARKVVFAQAATFTGKDLVAQATSQFSRWLDEKASDGTLNRKQHADAIVAELLRLGGVVPWTIARGDSGGPVLCRIKPSGDPFVVAVSSTMSLSEPVIKASADGASGKVSFDLKMDRSFIPDAGVLATYVSGNARTTCDTAKRDIPNSARACERDIREHFSREACVAIKVSCKSFAPPVTEYFCRVESRCPSTEAALRGCRYDVFRK